MVLVEILDYISKLLFIVNINFNFSERNFWKFYDDFVGIIIFFMVFLFSKVWL